MKETTITRNVKYWKGDAEGDAEIAIVVEGERDSHGEMEVMRAYKYDLLLDREVEVDLTDAELEWARRKLEDL